MLSVLSLWYGLTDLCRAHVLQVKHMEALK